MQEEYWVVENGVRRRAKKKNCKICDKEFITRIDRVKFCSRDCSSKAASKPKIKFTCSWCKNDVYKKNKELRNSKSGHYFCNRECKENAQKLGGIKEIQPPHYGTAKINYRDFFVLEELYCRRCGYKEFSCSVQIHHIDENHDNNTQSNLIPLCANCHFGLHFKHWKLEDIKV